MTNLAKKRTKQHCLLWRRCTGEFVFISLLFWKEHLSRCVIMVRFGTLYRLALAEMSISAIRESETTPNYWLAMHSTIVQKYRSVPQLLPMLIKNMLAAIYDSSMLLEHPVKCISSPRSSVFLAHSRSTWDQSGVHSPSVSESGVSIM